MIHRRNPWWWLAGLLGLPVALLILVLVFAMAEGQEIKHSKTATTSPPRVNATDWNAPMVVTGGVDGQAFLRDSTATYGWRFGAIAVTGGGTGFTGYTIGDLLYANATTTLARLASVADGNVLRSAGVGVAPLWGKIRLSGSPTDVTGTLAAINGGIGHAVFTVGDLLTADTTTTLAKLADIATGNALLSGGVGVAPSWGKIGLTTHISGTLAVGSGGTGLTSGTSGGLLGFTASGTLASSVALTANALMLGGGAGATPVPLGSLGTTTTILHGNAAGAPTFAAVSLTADVSGILAGANGGTGNGFFAVTGPMASLKTFTFPDASSTILTTNALVTVAQGGTGVGTLASNGVLYGNGTGAVQVTAQGGANTVLTANAGAPSFSTAPTLTSLAATSFLSVGSPAAAAGQVRIVNAGTVAWRNAANGADITLGVDTSDTLALGTGAADIQWQKPLVALGGGAAATLGTIGGSGPATAAQNSWMRVKDSAGIAFWVPAWK